MKTPTVDQLLAEKHNQHLRSKWVGVCAAIMCLGVLGWLGYRHFNPTKPKTKYITSPIKQGDLTVKVTATGTLLPINQVQIGSELSGTIQQVFVDSNDYVRKGQILATIDTSKLKEQMSRAQANIDGSQARLTQSQTQLQEAQSIYRRYQQVWQASNGAVPSLQEMDSARFKILQIQSDINNIKTSVRQAQADLSSLKVDLNRATIRAPISGVILKRQIDPGQTVASSLQSPQLFVLAQDLRQMKLQVNVSEADITQIKPGQEVSFTVDAWPNKKFMGVVLKSEFGSTTIDNVVNYQTTISVANPDLSLRPGMTATADIKTAELKNVWLVPNAALRFRLPKKEPNTSEKKSGGLLSQLTPKINTRPGFNSRDNRSAREPNDRDSSRIFLLDRKTELPKRIQVQVGLSDGKNSEILTTGMNTLPFSSSDQVIIGVESETMPK